MARTQDQILTIEDLGNMARDQVDQSLVGVVGKMDTLLEHVTEEVLWTLMALLYTAIIDIRDPITRATGMEQAGKTGLLGDQG